MSFHELIQRAFHKAGARVTLRSLAEPPHGSSQRPLAIDIARDESGEYFDVQLASNVWLAPLDVRSQSRHLLLRAWSPLGEDRFLCGHDEFHWFVAALPAHPAAESVDEAKEALKPQLVQKLENRKHRGKQPRMSDVYVRQGEWFFVPCPHASIDRNRIVSAGELRRRSDSKPHRCDFLYQDGEREYECQRFPKLAFYESEYKQILRTRRRAKNWKWRPMPFSPDIYVKGWVRHADHSPLFLDVWHRVEMNRETDELSMSRMVYRD